ncbi:serine hydrolase domain-containing protein [Candidatus Deianiraea vastatrix]|uniref:Penicillin-binding protein 4 n=1 Tax=Candidatus Deianiraea vastatrix TaxID=2163644 RepID=A0A5B8XEQ1_9RICK|nr:serine hydrolase domain-containing protein [Candidatus Deianiraea vastatrix]QED23792.1 Penicillin-binding protein 4* [Candidatus Deianiraea vastatrix]
MKLRYIFAIFVICGFSFFNSDDNKQAATKNNEVQIQKYEFKDLNDFITKAPGVAVLVIKDGNVVLKNGYGLANIQNKEKINSDTIFESGSLAKMFTAAAILNLEKDGKIDTTKPARNYLPKDFTFIPNNITVKNLIFHTSGVPDYLNDKRLNLNGKVNSDIQIENKDVIEYVKEYGVAKKEINTVFNYSNTNYVLLSMIIENVSQMTYADYMNNFFKSLNMHSFIHTKDRQKLPNESISYGEWPHFKILKNKTNYLTTGDFGIQISINDFEQWIKYITTNESLWNKYQETGYVVSNNVKTPIQYSYGMRFGKIGGIECMFHRGYINGASNIFLYNKDVNAFIVILSNTSSTFTDNLAEYILTEMKKVSDAQKAKNVALESK